MVKNGDLQRHVMVILNVDVLIPGHDFGKVLGSVNLNNGKAEETDVQASAAPSPIRSLMNQQVVPKTLSRAD